MGTEASRQPAGRVNTTQSQSKQENQTVATKTKPPYSADRKLQLCSRCGNYCKRSLNMCPTCQPYESPHYQAIATRIIAENNLQIRPEECLHLLGSDSRGNGFFLVNNSGGILDRETYRHIARTAKRFGFGKSLFIYGRLCTYSGPGIEFMQIDPEREEPLEIEPEQTGHTPGPWAKSRDAVPPGHVQITVYSQESGERVATAFEREANANLIAAAPDLLAACRAMLDCLENLTTAEFGRGGDKPARRMLEQAIYKAERGD